MASRIPKPPSGGRSSGVRGRTTGTGGAARRPTGGRSPRTDSNSPVRPVREADISVEQFRTLSQALNALDIDGTGFLPTPSVAGITIGPAPSVVDDRALRRLDRDKLGVISMESLASFAHPGVPKARIHDLLAREISGELFAQLRAAFMAIAPDGRLTDIKLKTAGEQILGHKLTQEQLSVATGGSPQNGVGFLDSLGAMFPSVPPKLFLRYSQNRISIEDFLEVKRKFDELDVMSKGMVHKSKLEQNPRIGDPLPGIFSRELMGSTVEMGSLQGERGQVTLTHLLRHFFPSLSDRILKIYVENYTHDRLPQIKSERQEVEQAETERRGNFEAEILRRLDKMAQAFLKSLPTEEEDGEDGEGDVPAEAADPKATESFRQAEVEARERAQQESAEDETRWKLAMDERKARLNLDDAKVVHYSSSYHRWQARRNLEAWNEEGSPEGA